MSQHEHDARVARLVARLRGRPSALGRASLAKSSESHFVPDPRDPRHGDAKIDVRELRHILEIDVGARICIAEPGVTFAELVRATLPHGLAPALVPELEGITIGGAVAGCAIESSAFRHGGFHDSCLAYEVVSATGDVLECSRERDAELFEMMHGSYGTLGILTKLTFRLVEAKPFVHVAYHRFDGFDAFHRALVRACDAEDVDFIDGIAHAADRFVLCLGRFVATAPATRDYRGTRIYYESTAALDEDHLTTYDYYFRFDTDCHWATRVIPGMRSHVGRALFGGLFLGSQKLLRWSRWLRPLERLRRTTPVVTDLLIPEPRVAAFYAWYEANTPFFPLWIVPYRMKTPYPWISARHLGDAPSELFIDFAIYGMPNDRPDVCLSELLEDETFARGGLKTLIGQNHYDEETFFRVYDRERYGRIKRRMDPNNVFRTLYDKRVRELEGSRARGNASARIAARRT